MAAMNTTAADMITCLDGRSNRDDFLLRLPNLERCLFNNGAHSVMFGLLAISSAAVVPRVFPSIMRYPWRKRPLPSAKMAFLLSAFLFGVVYTINCVAKVAGLKESDGHPLVQVTALLAYPTFNGPIVWLFLYLVFLPYSLSKTISPAVAKLITTKLNRLFGFTGAVVTLADALVLGIRIFPRFATDEGQILFAKLHFSAYTVNAALIVLVLGVGGIGLYRTISESIKIVSQKRVGIRVTNERKAAGMKSLKRRLVIIVGFIVINAAAVTLLGIMSLLIEPLAARTWLVFGLTMHVAVGGLHVALFTFQGPPRKKIMRSKVKPAAHESVVEVNVLEMQVP